MFSAIRHAATQFLRQAPKQPFIPQACCWKARSLATAKDLGFPTLTVRIPAFERELDEMHIGNIMQQLREIQSIVLPAENLKTNKEFLATLFKTIQKGGRVIESISAINGKTGKLHGMIPIHESLDSPKMGLLIEALSITSNDHRFEINLRP